MFKISNKNLSNNIIGKAYNIVIKEENILYTYFVLQENDNITFIPFFKRKINTTIEKEINFLEQKGYKSIDYWKKSNIKLQKTRKRIFK